jgi:hypothetical protein
MCHRPMALLCCSCSGGKVSRVGSNMFALFVRCLIGNCFFMWLGIFKSSFYIMVLNMRTTPESLNDPTCSPFVLFDKMWSSFSCFLLLL